MFSGFDGELRYCLEGSSAEDGLGFSVARAGDVNRDGVTDFVAGARSWNSPRSGYARVFSGEDGTVLLQLSGDSSTPWFGGSVNPAGDGLPDIAVEHGRTGPKSGIQVFSGADGRLLHDLRYAEDNQLKYGPGASLGIDDVDGDGHRDVAICCMVVNDERESWMRAHSTRSGEVLLDLTGRSRYAWGPAVACAGDVDADGTLDIVLGDLSFLTDGAVAVSSGKDGRVLHDLKGNHRMAMLGCSVGAAGDADGDGHDDFLVGIVNEWAPFQAGRVRIYSGRDASVIRQLSLDEHRSGE